MAMVYKGYILSYSRISDMVIFFTVFVFSLALSLSLSLFFFILSVLSSSSSPPLPSQLSSWFLFVNLVLAKVSFN